MPWLHIKAKTIRAVLLSLLTSLLAAVEANAAFIVQISQVGSDVVAQGSGSFNLAAVTYQGGAGGGSTIVPSSAVIGVGPLGNSLSEDAYSLSGVTGPTSFGPGGFTAPSSGGGSLMEFYRTSNYLYVYEGYISGTPINSTTTWSNASFASLGLTPGTYTWSWSLGQNSDSFTLIIGDTVSRVVEPVPVPTLAQWAMLVLAGLMALIGSIRLRRRSSLGR